MLLTILSGIVLIVGIVVLIIGNYYWGTDVLNIIGFSFAFIGVLVLMVCSVLAIIILRNGKEVARLISHDKSVSFLTDSLLGVLKGDYSEKGIKAERMSKYESID